MAFAIFNPPIDPTPGSTHARKLKLLEAEFGDGYSQSQPDGLNHIRREVTLQWDSLSLAQKQVIDGFLVARGGVSPFWYQVFGDDAPLKWTCKDWSAEAQAGYWRMSVTLTQSFTPDS